LQFSDAGVTDYITTAVYRRKTDGNISQLSFPAAGFFDSNLQANGSDVVYIETDGLGGTGSFLYDRTSAGLLELASGPNVAVANDGWVAWTQSTYTWKYVGPSMYFTLDWQLLLQSPGGNQQTLTTGTVGGWLLPNPAVTPVAVTSSGILLTTPDYTLPDGGQLWIDGGTQLAWDGWGTAEARGTSLYVMHHDTLFCVVDQVTGNPLCPDFDAGMPDAGSPVDAGQDAGMVADAGPDAGEMIDAGIDAGHIPDAGGASDAGDAGGSNGQGTTSGGGTTGGTTTAGSPPPTSNASGCATAPTQQEPSEWVIAILAASLAIARRPRRR
jgi:hypothetical protein